jgi:hypothetical protein
MMAVLWHPHIAGSNQHRIGSCRALSWVKATQAANYEEDHENDEQKAQGATMGAIHVAILILNQ